GVDEREQGRAHDEQQTCPRRDASHLMGARRYSLIAPSHSSTQALRWAAISSGAIISVFFGRDGKAEGRPPVVAVTGNIQLVVGMTSWNFALTMKSRNLWASSGCGAWVGTPATSTCKYWPSGNSAAAYWVFFSSMM